MVDRDPADFKPVDVVQAVSRRTAADRLSQSYYIFCEASRLAVGC